MSYEEMLAVLHRKKHAKHLANKASGMKVVRQLELERFNPSEGVAASKAEGLARSARPGVEPLLVLLHVAPTTSALVALPVERANHVTIGPLDHRLHDCVIDPLSEATNRRVVVRAPRGTCSAVIGRS